MKNSNSKFSEGLETLKNSQRELTYKEVQAFSDLETDRLDQFVKVWNYLSDKRKAMLTELMFIESYNNTMVDFSAVALLALNERDPFVRRISLKLLSENRKRTFLEKAILLSRSDPDLTVRLEAISVLGFFLTDMEKSARHREKANAALHALEMLQDVDDPAIQMQVMEALAYIDQPGILPKIRACLASSDDFAICAGLRAVQNSLNDQWSEDVLDLLDHTNPDIQLEAVKAAGLLQLKKARPIIFRMLATEFDSVDNEMLEALIIAASQFGGEQAKEMIEELEEVFEDEEDMTDLFDEAKSNLEFAAFQEKLAQHPDLQAVFGNEDEAEWEDEDSEAINYVELMREHIENLPPFVEQVEDDEDDYLDTASFDDDDDDDDDDEEDDEEIRLKPHHHRSNSMLDIDWSQFRIIEDLSHEDDLLDDEDDITFDPDADKKHPKK